MENNQQKISGLSEAESGFWQKVHNFKRPILLPIVKICQKIGLPANWISYAGVLCALIFYILVGQNLIWATVILFLGLFLDGLDGPLARESGTANKAGAITDITCDIFSMALAAMAWVKINLVNGELAIIFILLNTLIFVTTFIRNALNKPQSYMVVRPRITTYVLFLLFVIWQVNLLPIAFAVFAAYLLFFFLIDFLVIRKGVQN